MIRVLQKADIERVVDIWLDTNLKAHYFIPGQYWKNNIDLVKEMLPQAEVYVYENDCQIEGFIGLNDEYMEGIFVRDEMQSQGIGKLLLNFVKEKKTKLYLNVTKRIHVQFTFINEKVLKSNEKDWMNLPGKKTM